MYLVLYLIGVGGIFCIQFYDVHKVHKVHNILVLNMGSPIVHIKFKNPCGNYYASNLQLTVNVGLTSTKY